MAYLTIERFEEPRVKAYHIDGTFIGIIYNHNEFNKFRIQALQNQVTDQYYFMWDELKITLDNKGNMSHFPRGLYDQVQQDMGTMFRIAREQNIKI